MKAVEELWICGCHPTKELPHDTPELKWGPHDPHAKSCDPHQMDCAYLWGANWRGGRSPITWALPDRHPQSVNHRGKKPLNRTVEL